MRILYFGTVCDLKEYEKNLQSCRQKPTVATINYEMALLEGLKKNNINVDIYSFPMIPTFPRSKFLLWGNIKEKLECGYECIWLKTINLPFVKQISRKINSKRIIKEWLKKHSNDECVLLSYSVPPFLVKNIINYSRKYKVKCFAIIPDLVKNMYINSKSGALIKWIKNKYLEEALKYQGEYDGYIYLTEAMKEEVNPVKPYIVMEGIANIHTFSDVSEKEKSNNPVIMYAGRLHEKFGIINLIDAFELIENIDAELWIFGDGTAVKDVEARAEANCRIRYMGRRPLDEILQYEKKATLLVNPRNPKEEFTQFSFPSKTIEYMLSGTPVLTTKLPGIPEEYYKYIFCIDDNDAKTIASKIEEILSNQQCELEIIGKNALDYVIKEKNAETQVKRIVDFIKVIEEQKNNDS